MRAISCTLFLTACLSMAWGDTHWIKPDGTGDHATIQDAIDAAVDGDEILLADGVFKGMGNRNIDFKGKAITLRSKSGSAQDCVVDGEGDYTEIVRVFDFKSDEGRDSMLQDITIRGGTAMKIP